MLCYAPIPSYVTALENAQWARISKSNLGQIAATRSEFPTCRNYRKRLDNFLQTFPDKVANSSLTTFSPCARLEVGVFVITRMLGKNMPGLLYIGQMDKMLYTMQYMHFMQLGIYKYTNIALKWK